MWFFHNPGLLGINARNLHYIKAYNPKKAIMMADSKMKTKNFLSARGIPVAKLYGSIHNKKELENYDWNSLPDSFVVKPNSGYGGEGILIIIGRKGGNWVEGNGNIMTQDELGRHITDILDGRYSLANISDIAFFEQRLEAPEPFDKMSYKGLPDIRIVVHNLIPVMAMIRLSTEESQGKANVHFGGIAVGIDIAKGEMTHVTQYNKEIDSVPGFGPVRGTKIPNWDQILLIASSVQYITNLGFAAVDITLDKSGPILLEINARSGLAVQIANMAPLRRRLERIEGIKVATPEKGVRIAQDIFGQKIEHKEEKTKPEKPVVGNLERIEVIGKKGNKKIIAQIDPNVQKSILDEGVAEEIKLDEGQCKFNLIGHRIRTVVETANFGGKKYKMIIGQRDLRDFLIDPSKHMAAEKAASEKEASSVAHIVRQFSDEDLRKIDEELSKIDGEIHLLSYIKPTNIKEEHNKFLVDPTYNPQFEYKPLKFNPNNLYTRLKRIEFPDSAIGILWRKKADEIKRKIELLEARGKDHFTAKSIHLYGKPDEELLNEALKEAEKMPASFPESEKILNAKEAKKIFEQAIEDLGLKGWRIKIKKDMVSDAIAGKENSIMIREGATFAEDRLKGTIAHEIETHVFTAMNGSLQPYKLFQRGLADYLMTEEGLAVYNQEQTESSETAKKYWAASSVIGINTALNGSFADIYAELVRLGFDVERAWKVALKAKRGLTDTSQPGAFTKDFVYFKGYRMILDFVKNGGDLRELYYGKINLQDLDLVKKVKGLKAPTFLPTYLRGDE
ncbi:tyrosine/phenylalanine carboxypeptidase domain-containing protein [candidate division KSB1 bacterium]